MFRAFVSFDMIAFDGAAALATVSAVARHPLANHVRARRFARPTMTWTIDHTSGDITLTTSTQPVFVRQWTATTYDAIRRDFRLIKGDTPADPCTFIPVQVFGKARCRASRWRRALQGRGRARRRAHLLPCLLAACLMWFV